LFAYLTREDVQNFLLLLARKPLMGNSIAENPFDPEPPTYPKTSLEIVYTCIMRLYKQGSTGQSRYHG